MHIYPININTLRINVLFFLIASSYEQYFLTFLSSAMVLVSEPYNKPYQYVVRQANMLYKLFDRPTYRTICCSTGQYAIQTVPICCSTGQHAGQTVLICCSTANMLDKPYQYVVRQANMLYKLYQYVVRQANMLDKPY